MNLTHVGFAVLAAELVFIKIFLSFNPDVLIPTFLGPPKML